MISKCDYCGKQLDKDILCCLWYYYANNNNVSLKGYESWYKNNKGEIQNLINEERIKYDERQKKKDKRFFY